MWGSIEEVRVDYREGFLSDWRDCDFSGEERAIRQYDRPCMWVVRDLYDNIAIIQSVEGIDELYEARYDNGNVNVGCFWEKFAPTK
jgi:hypothetical protein